MKGSVNLVTVKGMQVRLHLTLLLFVGFVLFAAASGGMTGASLGWYALFIAAVFASIIFHEMGHAVVAASFGIAVKDITLYPIGGVASFESLPEKPRQELLISAAGPAVSFLLAGLFWLLSSANSGVPPSADVAVISGANFFWFLRTVNLYLALFNLLPAFPMDGGRILRALLALRFSYTKATTVATAISKVIASVMVIYGLGSFHFLLVFIGIFVLLFARAEEVFVHLKRLVKGMRLKEMLMYDYNGMDAELTVTEAANMLQHNHHKTFLVMKDGVPVGSLDRMDVVKAVAEERCAEPLTDLMKKNLVMLDGETPADSVLQKLSSHEETVYPVMEKGRFLGVINFQHIVEYLLLHRQFSDESYRAGSLAQLV
ncbi:site-2 protease family protein [Flavisolibacter nicotianae]|uniref:site-2 protease family protein n=1 Tax=Flavisolibacter nicotianae TaxID=2364882 RepID=UPI000EB404D8|nr:site-2 protease family protein [Flavisolibacter nicotianae]